MTLVSSRVEKRIVDNRQYAKKPQWPRTWIVLKLIKAAVLARIEDPEEQEAAQAHRPCDHEKSDYHLRNVDGSAIAAAT